MLLLYFKRVGFVLPTLSPLCPYFISTIFAWEAREAIRHPTHGDHVAEHPTFILMLKMQARVPLLNGCKLQVLGRLCGEFYYAPFGMPHDSVAFSMFD